MRDIRADICAMNPGTFLRFTAAVLFLATAAFLPGQVTNPAGTAGATGTAGAGADGGGLTVTLASKRSSVLPFQAVDLTVTVANTGSAPSRALARSSFAAPRTIICAGPPNEDVVRKGAWAEHSGPAGEGLLGPLLPGESFTIPVRIALPAEMTSRGVPVYLQWVGRDENAGLRSNELMITLQSGTNPVATIETSKGVISLELWADKAPNHVANLVELAQKGFYDGLKFHRVVRNFMIQGGCPKGDGTGDAGYKIPAEFNDTDFKKGILGMARAQDNDSAGSQFFICVADVTHLNKQYTAFGRVLEGQDVADQISFVPVKGERPTEDIVIKKLTVELPATYQKPALKKAGEQGQ